MNIQELGELGNRINKAITEIDAIILANGLTLEDLNEFDRYLSRQESIGPVLNPTFYAHHGGFKMIEMARDRVEKLRTLMIGGNSDV